MAGGTETPHIAAPPALARLAPFAIAQKSYFALNGAIGDAADSVMKTMSARDAKNGFGLMIDTRVPSRC